MDSVLLPVVLIVVTSAVLFLLKGRQDASRPLPPQVSFSWRPTILDFFNDPIGCSEKANREYGGVWSFSMGARRWIMVTDQSLFKAHFQATDDVLSLGKAVDILIPHVFGKGIFDYNAEWTAGYRKLITAGFWRQTQLSTYEPIIQQEIDRFLAGWEAKYAANGEWFDIFRQTARVTALINLRIMMGEKAADQHHEEWAEWFPELDRLSSDRLVTMMPWLPFGKPAKFQESRRRCLAMIEESWESALESLRDELGEKKSVTDSYMEMMIRNFEGKFPRELLYSHIIAMAVAAHLNTVNTIGWAVAHISAEKPVMDKLRSEAEGQYDFRDISNKDDDFGTVNATSYAQCILKEAVRMYPVLGTARAAPEDMQIPGSKYWAQKGDIISVNGIWVHRDPNNFEEPNKFKPERFENPEVVKTWSNALTFVGFGNGVHRCLGEKFILLLGKKFLHSVFSRFDVELKDQKIPAPFWSAGSDPGPAEPVFIRIKPRK